MKLLLFILWATIAVAAESTFPTEIKLTTGGTLRNTKAERFESDYVIIRHVGGVDRVRYVNIAEPGRAAVIAARDQARAAGPAKPVDKSRTVQGEMFVTTAGAGTYKFGDFVLKAYSTAEWESAKNSQANNLPLNYRSLGAEQQTAAEMDAWIAALSERPVAATARTDSEGKFELKLPDAEPYFVFAGSSRVVGKYREWNLWALPVPAEGKLQLSGSNQWIQK